MFLSHRNFTPLLIHKGFSEAERSQTYIWNDHFVRWHFGYLFAIYMWYYIIFIYLCRQGEKFLT